jgi:hypothetical protein
MEDSNQEGGESQAKVEEMTSLELQSSHNVSWQSYENKLMDSWVQFHYINEVIITNR